METSRERKLRSNSPTHTAHTARSHTHGSHTAPVRWALADNWCLEMLRRERLSMLWWVTISCCVHLSVCHVHYVSSASIYRTCGDICSYRGYECSDSRVEQMDCHFTATDVCGKELSLASDQQFACSHGGCYVNCDAGYYADKSSSSSLSCSSTSDCYNRQGSLTFSQICACESNESSPLTVGQIIGIACAVFFFCTMVCALFIYCFMEYQAKK